jgi:hypothetical protein
VRDWFVANLGRSGASLDWSTYLGGSGYDGLSPVLRVDRDGNADANAGGADLGLVELDRDGHLRFSSYFGGSGDEDSTGSNAAFDDRGTFYAGGVTSSTDLAATPDAVQHTFGGGDIDGLLVKVHFPRTWHNRERGHCTRG